MFNQTAADKYIKSQIKVMMSTLKDGYGLNAQSALQRIIFLCASDLNTNKKRKDIESQSGSEDNMDTNCTLGKQRT